MLSHVAIFGPGLLGGSLALALKARTDARVSVWARRESAAEEVKARGCADVVSTEVREVVAGANLIVLATPVGAMPQLAREIAPHVAPGAIVTDVGSVKAVVAQEVTPIFSERRPGAVFIGSHPMAGSEQTGLGAARADLFDGTVCIITPEAATPASASEEAAALWQSVGCTVRSLSPGDHDLFVAWISHLPHLLAAVLVNAVADHSPGAFDFCGPGFRDTTRVASGPPAMWTEILGENREALRLAVDGLIEKLQAASKLLDRVRPGERDSLMNTLLTQAKAQRDRLRLPKNPHDVC
jgi:prephenate dehydrogenase